MKTIRKFSTNRYFAGFLCLALLSLSCSKSKTSDVGSRIKGNLSGEQMFREIFLFQGVDLEKKLPSLAGVINTLGNNDTSKKGELKGMGDQIILTIKKTDPNFFNQLKRTVESKNLYEIKKILASGATLYVKSLLKSEKYGTMTKNVLGTLEKVKTNYDLNKKEDVAKLSLYLKTSEEKRNLSQLTMKGEKGNPSQLQANTEGVQSGDCLTVAAVVAAVVWEAGAAVNVVVVATAAVFVYAAFWGPETSSATSNSENSLRNDQIALDIANNY